MTTVPRNKGSYYPRKSGRFQVRYPLGWDESAGKYRDYREDVDSESEAIALVKHINDFIYHGGRPTEIEAWRLEETEGPLKKCPNFDEFAKGYIDIRRRQGDVEERTIGSDIDCMRRLSPYFGKRTLDEVSAYDIECVYANMKSGGRLNPDGRTYSGTTLQKTHAFLNMLFGKAVDYGIIEKNPCAKVKAPKRDTPEKFSLDASGARNLFAFIVSEPLDARPVGVLLGLCCGLRLSEMLALTWKDYRGGFIRVNKSLLSEKQGFKNTKNGEERLIPCPPSMAKVLKEWKAIQKDWYVDRGLVWTSDAPIVQSGVGNHVLQRSYTRWFASARLRYPIPNDMGFHCLRHTFVTLLSRDCHVDGRTARSLSGHKSEQSFQVYTHTNDEYRRYAVAELNEIISPSDDSIFCLNCKRWTPAPGDLTRGACWACEPLSVTEASNKCDKGKFVMRDPGMTMAT